MPQHLLKPENLQIPRMEEGDAGLLLKADGSFQVFNCHSNIDPKNLTERQAEQGQQLQAILVALQTPSVMQALINLANDTNLFHEAPISHASAH